MSEFHKFVRETQAEYSKPDVEDTYHYVKKCEIFWAEVQKFEQSGTLKINPK